MALIFEKYIADKFMGYIKEKPANKYSVAGAGLLGLWYLYRYYQSTRHLEINNKAVFITGCDSGFGKEFAIKFRKLGYAVFAGCLDAETAREETFSDLIAENPELFHVVPLDVTSQHQVDSALTYTKNWLEANPDFRFWCLVNNAGISTFGPVEFVSMETVERVMSCNYMGSVRLSKAFVPLMRQREPWGGRVIFLGSIGGHMPCPATSGYGCTKAAILFLADTLRMELDRFGIGVSCILPDFYMTNILEPTKSVESFGKEIDQTDQQVVEHYGGESYASRLRTFLTVVSPPRAKRDLSPVVNAVVDAASAKLPKRRYYPTSNLTKVLVAIFDFAPEFYLSMMKTFL